MQHWKEEKERIHTIQISNCDGANKFAKGKYRD